MSSPVRTRIGSGLYDAIIRKDYADATRETLQGWCRQWGVDISDIRRRAKIMGVRRDLGAARLAYSEASSEAARFRREGINPHDFYNPTKDRLTDRDDDYVAACIAQGGFVRAEVINGRTVWVRAA